MKRCFVLLIHFIVVKDFRLFWSTNHPLSVPFILEYLRIFFPMFFILNEQKKVNKAVWETESLIFRLESIKPTCWSFKFLSVRIISLYRKLQQQRRVIMIVMNKLRKIWFHSIFLVKFHEIRTNSGWQLLIFELE